MLRLVAAALGALALVAPSPASALSCPERPLRGQLDLADVAFVGRLVSQRPVEGAPATTSYRFLVDQRVKGPVGREIEVRGAALTDVTGKPLEQDVAVGVLGSQRGGTFATSSCSLVDAGALLSVADEPRGTLIKVAIGLVILGLVLAFAVRRLRRRQRALLEGAGLGANGRAPESPPR